MRKRISVYTNDPKAREIYLTISGKVEGYLIVMPQRVVLRGAAGSPLIQKVKLLPRRKYPFRILSEHTGGNENYRYAFAAINGNEKAGYLLTVENLKTSPGRYFGSIVLKTDNEAKPQITVRVIGHILAEQKKD